MSRSILAWAIARALRFAIGTGVVALLLATTLSGDAAERFATAAYLCAIFAAFALALGRFFPPVAEERRQPSPAFPLFLGYSVGVVIFLSVMAVLVSQPAAEVLALVLAVGVVVTAVLVRSGTLRALRALLGRGGFLVGASRYVAVAIVAALGCVAALGSDADAMATFAFRLTVLATFLIGVSLLAPTKAGLWLQERRSKSIERLDLLARAFVFERVATYAAIFAVAMMVTASLLPPPYGEGFALAAYLAAAAAGFGVAMECRRLLS